MEKQVWKGSITSLATNWRDIEGWHREMNELFADNVNYNDDLKNLRDWVEGNVWGFGERSFYWMWKLLVDEMPNEFTFMEIGVFRGQILALINLLAKRSGKIAHIIGMSPLDSTDGYWESDYVKDIEKIFDTFQLKKDYIIFKGSSTSPEALHMIENNEMPPVDILFIDGGHGKEIVKSDIMNYTPLLKVGGYLVMDDCCTRFNLPEGYFRGHEEVSNAVDELLPPFAHNENFEFLFNIVHDRIWRKIK